MRNKYVTSVMGVVSAAYAWVVTAGHAFAQAPKLKDPLGGVTLKGFLENTIEFLLGLVGLLALLALIWGGMQYIISFGDEAKMKHGKQIIIWAILGLIIIGSAYVIISVVRSLLGI